MKFLCETDQHTKFFTEKKNDKEDLFLEGITLVADTKNANNRIYPKKILSEAIKKHSEEFLSTGGAVGELNHPKEDLSQINFDNVSHKFVEINEDGKNFRTKALILNTRSGKQVKNLHEGGVRLGISSRAFGDTRLENNTSMIESLYIVSFGDIVANPSAPGAFISAVMENKNFLWENGKLVEKDFQEKLEGYKKIIENSNKKERSTLFIKIFSNYMDSLKSK